MTAAGNGNPASQESSGNVRVVARIRPLSTTEKERGSKETIISLSTLQKSFMEGEYGGTNNNGSGMTMKKESSGGPEMVQAKVPGGRKRWFELDAVFDKSSTQQEVYARSGAKSSVCEDIFKGYNCTILAYGQTGAGKSFSMGTASTSQDSGDFVSEMDGMIPRACHDLFQSIDQKCDGNATVELSYLEIYNEELRDLLVDDAQSKAQPLKIRETLNGEVYVAGLQANEVRSPKDIGKLMEEASKRRIVAATAMNAVSSRSHAMCVLNVKGVVEGADGPDRFSAKLTLVDLAGSERIKKTGAEGSRAKEGININKSLLVLGQVVSALAEKDKKRKRKPPYRDSKLTRLLQDSLGGNSRTIMIACVSPADFNVDESINTLRYATSARAIKNTATQNIVKNISPQEAAKLQRENQLLKQQVAELQKSLDTLMRQSGLQSFHVEPSKPDIAEGETETDTTGSTQTTPVVTDDEDEDNDHNDHVHKANNDKEINHTIDADEIRQEQQTEPKQDNAESQEQQPEHYRIESPEKEYDSVENQEQQSEHDNDEKQEQQPEHDNDEDQVQQPEHDNDEDQVQQPEHDNDEGQVQQPEHDNDEILGQQPGHTNDDSELISAEQPIEQCHGKNIVQREKQRKDQSKYVTELEKELKVLQRAAAVELPALKIEIVELRQELERKTHLDDQNKRLREELEEAKIEAYCAEVTADRLSDIIEELSDKAEELPNRKKMKLEHLRKEEAWVAFVGGMLEQNKLQLSKIIDHFAQVVHVAENYSDTNINMPKKRHWWGGGMGIDHHHSRDEGGPPKTRKQLLKENVTLFEGKIQEMQFNLRTESDSLREIGASLKTEREKLRFEVDEEDGLMARSMRSRRGVRSTRRGLTMRRST